LVIDPTLAYSTYLGGKGGDHGYCIAVDDSGNAYVGGSVSSFFETPFLPKIDFPQKNEIPIDSNFEGSLGFVTKLNTNLSGAASLLYSTLLGGHRQDQIAADTDIAGIAVDASANVYVTGTTNAADFPLLNELQGSQRGVDDAFVTRLDTNASGAASLIYSTYLGGSDQDRGFGIDVTSSGLAYVTGYTDSADFPLMNAYDSGPPNSILVAFVTKLDTNTSGSSSLLYSTFLGGNDTSQGNGIATDGGGGAFVVGITKATDFPLKNQYQSDQPGDDAFVTRINTLSSGASSLVYSTYLGGSGSDLGLAIAQRAGFAFVTGETRSTDFPLKHEFQTGLHGSSDAFVTRLNTNATGAASLDYSTYLGGANDDRGTGIAVDSLSNARELINLSRIGP
jgi:hypothetical protein